MAYVTLDEFKHSPVHAVDPMELVPGGTIEQNDAALTTILEAASKRVDDELDVDTLLASTSTQIARRTVDRYGDIIVRPRNVPIKSVESAKLRFGPSDVTNVPLDKTEIIGQGIVIHGVVEGEWRHPAEVFRGPITVEVTYTHGYDTADIPINVKMATILFTASLIKQRGSASVNMDGAPSVMGGNPYDQGDENKAKALLRALKRVIVG